MTKIAKRERVSLYVQTKKFQTYLLTCDSFIVWHFHLRIMPDVQRFLLV